MSGKFVTGLPPGFEPAGDALRCPGLLVCGLERVATGLGSEPNTAEERRRGTERVCRGWGWNPSTAENRRPETQGPICGGEGIGTPVRRVAPTRGRAQGFSTTRKKEPACLQVKQLALWLAVLWLCHWRVTCLCDY